MTKAVIYARVSSVGDRQSTERQVSDLVDYSTKNGLSVEQVFEEHISGATKNEDRAVLCECLNFCVANKIDTLLISELSRLGRNVDEVLANVKFCKDSHLNIYFQKENLSLFNADGSKNPFLTIFISVLATCAELERDSIKFRLQSGLRRYRENNGVMGRKVGSVKSKEKKQQEYAKVIKLLKGGQSVRNTAKLCEVGISTVQRIKKEFAI